MSQLWKHRVVKLDLQRFGNTVERIQPDAAFGRRPGLRAGIGD